MTQIDQSASTQNSFDLANFRLAADSGASTTRSNFAPGSSLVARRQERLAAAQQSIGDEAHPFMEDCVPSRGIGLVDRPGLDRKSCLTEGTDCPRHMQG